MFDRDKLGFLKLQFACTVCRTNRDSSPCDLYIMTLALKRQPAGDGS